MPKLVSVLAATLLASSTVHAFIGTCFCPPVRTLDLTLYAQRVTGDNKKAAAVILATVLGLGVLNADFVSAKSFESSSIFIADQIKTFDMSLPSYDKISDARASLVAVEDKEAKAALKAALKGETAETKSSASQSDSSGVGGMISDSTSSMFKPKTKSKADRIAAREAKQAALAEEMAKREAILNQKIEF